MISSQVLSENIMTYSIETRSGRNPDNQLGLLEEVGGELSICQQPFLPISAAELKYGEF